MAENVGALLINLITASDQIFDNYFVGFESYQVRIYLYVCIRNIILYNLDLDYYSIYMLPPEWKIMSVNNF